MLCWGFVGIVLCSSGVALSGCYKKEQHEKTTAVHADDVTKDASAVLERGPGRLRTLEELGAAVQYDANGEVTFIAIGIPLGKDGRPHVLMSDNELAQFAEFSTLKFLCLLNQRSVTDTGIRNLAQLNALEGLELNGANITDESMKHIGALKKLVSLSLERTKITDVGLHHLSQLKNLKELYLGGTNVTVDKVEEFRKSLPQCFVTWPDLAVPSGIAY